MVDLWPTGRYPVAVSPHAIPTSPPHCCDSVLHSIENHRPFLVTTIIVNFRPFLPFFLFFPLPPTNSYFLGGTLIEQRPVYFFFLFYLFTYYVQHDESALPKKVRDNKEIVDF